MLDAVLWAAALQAQSVAIIGQNDVLQQEQRCRRLASAALPDKPNPLEQVARTYVFDQSGLKKDEFESTSDFLARQSALTRKLKSLNPFVTFLHVSPENVSYNADTEILSIKALSYEGKLGGYGLLAFSFDIKSDEVTGVNGFGATRTVERSLDGLGYLMISEDDVRASFREQELTVPLAPSDARRFKQNPSLIFVGQLKDQPIRYAFDRSRATFDSPFDISFRMWGFAAQPECVVLRAGGKDIGVISVPR